MPGAREMEAQLSAIRERRAKAKSWRTFKAQLKRKLFGCFLMSGKPDGLIVSSSKCCFAVNIDEVYALEQLYKDVSNSLHQDGVIQKDEFMQALFNTQPGNGNLFADRLFVLFDLKKNNVVEFSEFVRALSVFHPKAPLEEKAEFAFRLYDLDRTGDIQPSEVARLLGALLLNIPDIALDDSSIQKIVDQTFEEADLAKDGRISHEEWLILVQKHPVIINYMTLPVLREVTMKYPSFMWAARES